MEGSRPWPAVNTGSRKSNLSDDIWSDIADVFKLENRTDRVTTLEYMQMTAVCGLSLLLFLIRQWKMRNSRRLGGAKTH
jgi:hypothetical protein